MRLFLMSRFITAFVLLALYWFSVIPEGMARSILLFFAVALAAIDMVRENYRTSLFTRAYLGAIDLFAFGTA